MNIKQILQSFNLDEIDISEIQFNYPEIFNHNPELIATNIEILIQFGFPQHEMNFLIIQNPMFLITNSDILYEHVKQLGKDIESKLKKDPFLI